MKIIVVGCGLAGATAVRTLRGIDPRAEIDLYGSEPHPYYQRPRLWEYIAGKAQDVESLYFRKADWYETKGIRLHLATRVVRIDPDKKSVLFSDGGSDSYDRLLLATGADSFVPPLRGTNLEGVFALRSMQDALNITAHADQVKHVTVIGGGLLGLETANALRMRGKQAAVIEFIPRLLPRQLDEEGSYILKTFIETLGMQVITGAETDLIEKEHETLIVRLKDGRSLKTGMVIFSTGIRSRVGLAQDAGLEVHKGIVVDDHLQTSAADIYAAGDAAQHRGIIYGIIPATMEQAQAATHHMLEDNATPYTGTIPNTRLKAVGLEIASLGDAVTSDEDVKAVCYENINQNIYRRINVRNGRVIGAILVGNLSPLQPIRHLIDTGTDVNTHLEVMQSADFDFVKLEPGE